MAKRALSFEMFAVTLLMCSPTKLSRAWTDSEDKKVEDAVTKALDVLPFTDGVRKNAIKLLMRLKGQRRFFAGIADTLRLAAYDGNEPHPDVAASKAIILALQKVDAEASARRRRRGRRGSKR
jgi:hypothetical protein